MGPNDILLSSEEFPSAEAANKPRDPHSQTHAENERPWDTQPKRMFPSNFSHKSSGNPIEEAETNNVKAREMEDTKKTRPLSHHDQSSYDLTQTEVPCTRSALHKLYPVLCAQIYYGFQFSIFMKFWSV